MRQYFYNLLERSDSGSIARLVSSLLMLLIICNVMAVILASDSAIYTELQPFFDHFELFQ